MRLGQDLHSEELWAPSSGKKVPPGQSRQTWEGLFSRYFPGGHDLQASALHVACSRLAPPHGEPPFAAACSTRRSL